MEYNFVNMDDDDENVCKILEDLEKPVLLNYFSSSQVEMEDNEDSLMDEAVLPCLLMSKDINKHNISDLLDPQKSVEVEQNIDIKIETLANLWKEEVNQINEENLSSKQTEENLQHKSSEGLGKTKHKSDRIDVLVILENDRRKVVNVNRYSKIKHLQKKFLKIMHKDPLYTKIVDEGAEIIFQTYHDKFKTWVDAEQDLVLNDGMNLKVIFASSKTQKEKERKRLYTCSNIEDHDDIKNLSKPKSKKLKSTVSRLEKSRSRSPSPSSWLKRPRPPPPRFLKAVESYTYYKKRDHKSKSSEKSRHTSEFYYELGRGNPTKSYIDNHNKGGKACNRVYHQAATTSYKNRLAYNTVPLNSYQQVNKTQTYSDELNSFLKMVEKQKAEKNESVDKVDEVEKVLENNSQIEDEEEGECKEETDEAVVKNNPCDELQCILLSKKEIDLFSARLRINEKHPVQAVQELCASVYKKPPIFQIHEERCPQTKHMIYKYTLNVLGNLFTPDKTQFNKKAAKVDAAILFLKHTGFK